MQQKNERGEQARNYFIKVEDMLKKSVQSKLHQPYDNVKAFSPGEISNLLKVTVSVMQKQNSPGKKIARQFQLTCSQFGIKTINDFVESPPYEQLELAGYNGLTAERIAE